MSDKSNNETTKSQAAFLQYCALGPDRSLSKLAQVLGKSGGYVGQLERWSSQYGWVKRAREYDAEILQKEADAKAKKRAKDIEKMHERHALIGTTQQQRALQVLDELIKAGDLNGANAIQLLKLGVQIERDAREIPDKIELTGQDGGPIFIKTVWGTPKVERKNNDE